jgi:hypothetical protein
LKYGCKYAFLYFWLLGGLTPGSEKDPYPPPVPPAPDTEKYKIYAKSRIKYQKPIDNYGKS